MVSPSAILISLLLSCTSTMSMALPNANPDAMPTAAPVPVPFAGALAAPQVSAYQQCGGLLSNGQPYTGSEQCQNGYACGCVYGSYSICTDVARATQCHITSVQNNNQGTASLYGTCGGGATYTGPTRCPTGATCSTANAYAILCYPTAH